MPGKFVVKQGSTGKFRFVLLSTNGQVIATSEAYNTKAACLNGVRAVKTIAADAAIDDQTAANLPRKAGAKAGTAVKAAKKTGEETATAVKTAKKAATRAVKD